MFHAFHREDFVPANHPRRPIKRRADDDERGNPTGNFRGEKRANKTHRSLADPEARLARTWFVGRGKIRPPSAATAAAYNRLRLARLAPGPCNPRPPPARRGLRHQRKTRPNATT